MDPFQLEIKENVKVFFLFFFLTFLKLIFSSFFFEKPQKPTNCLTFCCRNKKGHRTRAAKSNSCLLLKFSLK